MEKQKETKEIDVIGIIKKILSDKISLATFLGAFAVLGVIVGISMPKTYTTSVILAPEMSSGGMGMSESLSDMASSFGLDLGSKGSVDAIYPEIYPEIFASSDFILTLFDIPVQQKDSTTVKTYKQHLTQDMKVPFWEKPSIWISEIFAKKKVATKKKNGINPFKLTKEEDGLCNAIRGTISCQVDNKTSVITITSTDQDPLVSAIMADTLQHRLQEYITNYKTKKARNDLMYYQKLYSEAKASYVKAQQLYASYSDANQDVILESFKAKQDEMENEMQLKYNAYTQISAQLQTAKAKIQEQTPAFTVVQSASMPNKASSTPRSMIVMLFIVLGFFADSLWVLYLKKLFIKK